MFPLQIVDIICPNQLQAKIFRQFWGLFEHRPLTLNPMLLYFDVEIVSEDIPVDLGGCVGLSIIAGDQVRRHNPPTQAESPRAQHGMCAELPYRSWVYSRTLQGGRWC